MNSGSGRLRILVVGVLVIVLVLLVVGVVAPKLFIGSGVGLYEGDERDFAGYAVSWEPMVRDDPLPFVMARRVAEVEELPRKGYACVPNADVSRPYEARIKLYTFFGIPSGTTVLDCYGNGSVSHGFVLVPLMYLTLSIPLLFLGAVVVLTALAMNRHYRR